MIKALTLTEPWATLMALLEKNVETRSWTTSYRGLIAIHAAKSYPKYAREFRLENPFVKESLFFSQALGDNLGSVLCVRNLIACQTTELFLRDHKPDEKEIAFGDYSRGRFAWVFDKSIRFFTPPIPAKGSLGLWNWQEPQ